MPIQSVPDGVLDVENATLRASGMVATKDMVIGKTAKKTSDVPTLEVFSEGAATIELQSNLARSTNTSNAFARIKADSQALTFESGSGLAHDSKGDIVFSSVGDATKHMVIKGSTGKIGIGVENPSSALDIAGDINLIGQNAKIKMNSDVLVEHAGPHGRGVAPLKKYPEIIFADGKFDRNDTTNTYVQAGYTVTANSTHENRNHEPWKIFDGSQSNEWQISTTQGGDRYSESTGTYNTGVDLAGVTVADQTYNGDWVQVSLPRKIKVDHMNLATPATYGDSRMPEQGVLLGSNNGSNWSNVASFGQVSYPDGSFTRISINSAEYYSYYRMIWLTVTAGDDSTHRDRAALSEWELYGYEEDPPLGDTSVDTTFTSIMNTPQTTGANVYVDAKLSSDFTNQVTGPTPVGTAAVHDNTNKYWELNGQLTSNVTLEANTFLEGDQPHAVSVWFNSSNLEANVSNTCVFSVSDQEHLNSQNLDLQSNTWHNLTYAYQGEGGSKVTYLDGRKVAEDQAEDTFGEYPPFAMTGYSQGGYVVSSSREYVNVASGGTFPSWHCFNKSSSDAGSYIGLDYAYNGANGIYTANGEPLKNLGTATGSSTTINGEYVIIEMPHKLKLSYVNVKERGSQTTHAPGDGKIYGSNDGTRWVEIASFSGLTYNNTDTIYTPITVNADTAYEMFAFVVSKNAGYSGYSSIGELRYYGHRENDLVRLPDPTNVLKYPHIDFPIGSNSNDPTGIRGYVASASSSSNSGIGRRPWSVFNDLGEGAANLGGLWQNAEDGSNHKYTPQTTGLATTNAALFEGVRGEWIKLELPHKLKVSQVYILTNGSHEGVEKAILYGSNDDTNWDVIKDSGTAGVGFTFTLTTSGGLKEATESVTTSNYYKYLLLQVTEVVVGSGSTDGRSLQMYKLQYYGTEEATPVPLQIGGGNIDKVANFRVYDKFIEEDQALEIWDAQKDEFGRAKSSMTLHKGRLGIGTTEPQGRLAVLDEPHGLEEFPPRAMTGYKTYFEGHGEFCVRESSYYSSGYEGWRVFDNYTNSNGTNDPSDRWTALSSTSTIGSLTGKWVKLELPYRVNFSKVGMFPPSYPGGSTQCPTGFSIIVSNDDETWTTIKTLSGYTWKEFAYNYITFENDGYFKYIAIVATTDGGSQNTSFQELKYFGIREQGQSVLHDGQLTLTKNLTVPRIGPEIGEYPTPRRTNLKVEFDTSLAIHGDGNGGRPFSTSGQDFAYAYTNDAHYSVADKAFKFPSGTSTATDVIYGYHGFTLGTSPAHTQSLWVKRTSYGYNANDWQWAAMFGNASGSGHMSGVLFQASGHRISFDIENTRILSKKVIELNRWYHVVCTFSGGTSVWNTKNCKIYIDGVDDTDLDSLSGSNPFILGNGSVGTWVVLGGTDYYTRGMTGLISNYKLYDVALTPDEVYTLYKQGKDQQTHHLQLVNTTMTIGPQNRNIDAMLDVAGRIRVGASTTLSFTGQHICSVDEPMEKGLIVSAKKNRFVKLNGFATGREAITVDESLPIVSLSNVAQDKACFGVVSSIEKPSSKRKQEIGGVISETNKENGDNRAIVNSVGEGAIWVVNTGGSLESGDYITTSNVVGYGQKQDGAGLMNYTVAKITMDCDFTASNVAVQTIKREETGLRTITEDTWNQLVDYDRSSNTETQYSNTLVSSAYTDQPGYTPREVTTIMDYTDGSNLISTAEWSNLESNIQNTYQSNTFTEIVDYTKFVNLSEWSNLTTDVQNTYSEAEITTYYQIQRGENVLDENGQLQFEDKTGATEAPYERRFLDASGAQTDEANAVHIAAFVGCTYHCG